MAALFVTGSGTDVGKTYIAAALIRARLARGRATDALKPVVSGFDEAAPQDSDPAVLLDALGGGGHGAQALDRIAPFRFRAGLSPPLAARLEGRTLDGDRVIDLCRSRIAEAGDRLLVIEGAGGVMSPLDDRRTMLDLMTALRVPVILVTGSYLGAISHALTARLALRSAGLEVQAMVVSESPAPSPPLDETLSAIRRLAPHERIVRIARDEDWRSAPIAELIGLAADDDNLDMWEKTHL